MILLTISNIFVRIVCYQSILNKFITLVLFRINCGVYFIFILLSWVKSSRVESTQFTPLNFSESTREQQSSSRKTYSWVESTRLASRYQIDTHKSSTWPYARKTSRDKLGWILVWFVFSGLNLFALLFFLLTFLGLEMIHLEAQYIATNIEL